MSGAVDGLDAVRAVADVSRETGAQLEAYVALVRKWQPVENLVSPGDIAELWRRHVADSAQLPGLMPKARRWLDIGSGAGLPGLVIALVGPPGTHVDLIEANQRKCAFLREAIRVTRAPASVHAGRAETLLAAWDKPIDCVTARGVAALPRLLELAAPVLLGGVPALFPKGRDFQREIDQAADAWESDLVKHESRIGEGGVILEIRHLKRR